MPKSLLVFVVSFTPETPNLGRSVESRNLPGGIFYYFFTFFNCVYAHISNLNHKNILIYKKNKFRNLNVFCPVYYSHWR